MMALSAARAATITARAQPGAKPPPSLPPKGTLQGWLGLLACFLALWGFIYVLAPWLQGQSTAVRTLSNYITENGIDAGAVYYTEVTEVGEADLMIRDTFRFYLPQQQNK